MLQQKVKEEAEKKAAAVSMSTKMATLTIVKYGAI